MHANSGSMEPPVFAVVELCRRCSQLIPCNCVCEASQPSTLRGKGCYVKLGIQGNKQWFNGNTTCAYNGCKIWKQASQGLADGTGPAFSSYPVPSAFAQMPVAVAMPQLSATSGNCQPPFQLPVWSTPASTDVLHLAAESSELRVTKLKVTELEAERLRTQAEFNRLKLEFAELKQAASSVATEKVVADSELKLLRLEIAELETVVSNAATEKAVVGKATTLIESNVQKLTSANKQLEASVASLTSENTKLVAGLDRIEAAQHWKAEKKIPASSTTQASAQQSATASCPPRVPKSAVRHTIQSHTLDDDDAAEQKALDKAAAQSSHSQGNASKAATARSSATSTRPVTATACFSANPSPQTNSTLSKDASHKRTPAAEDTTELPSPKRTSSRHNGAVVGFADNASATTAIHAVWQGGVPPEPPHTWDEQMYVDIPGAESLTHREQIVRKLKQHPYLVSQLAVTNFKHMLLEEDIYEVVVTAASLIPATPQECAFLATKCCRAPYSSAVGFCIVCKIREPDCMKHPARVDPRSSELLSDLLVCYPHDRPLPGHDSLQGWPELVKLVSLGALQQMIATLEKPPPPPPSPHDGDTSC